MSDKKSETKPDRRSLNIYQKLAAITGEIGVINKDGNNTEQNFKFIEYAAVAGRLRTLFAEYGVVVVPRMQRASKQHREVITSKYGKSGQFVLVDMYFHVVNADDPKDCFNVPWTGEAADFGDKATNKAATSALKYYLMRQFNISEKGEDNDEHTPETTAPARPAVGTATSAPKRVDQNAVTRDQVVKLQALFGDLRLGGDNNRDKRLEYASNVLGQKLASLNNITKADAHKLIETLQNDVESAAANAAHGPEVYDEPYGDLHPDDITPLDTSAPTKASTELQLKQIVALVRGKGSDLSTDEWLTDNYGLTLADLRDWNDAQMIIDDLRAQAKPTTETNS